MTEHIQQPENPDTTQLPAAPANSVAGAQSGLASAAGGSAQTENTDKAVAGQDSGNRAQDTSADPAKLAEDTALPRRPGVLRRTLNDPHQRPLVIGAATLGVGVIVAAVILLMPAHHSEISQAGQATQMRPIPGGSSSARYKAQLAAYNAAQAKRAAALHQSELPTMGSLHKVTHHKKPLKPQTPQPYHQPSPPKQVHYGPNPYAKAIQSEVTALMTESIHKIQGGDVTRVQGHGGRCPGIQVHGQSDNTRGDRRQRGLCRLLVEGDFAANPADLAGTEGPFRTHGLMQSVDPWQRG